jgi:hypothetical protein
MEPEGTLPRSQEPATGPYSEPDASNPHLHISLRSKQTEDKLQSGGSNDGSGHLVTYQKGVSGKQNEYRLLK